MLIDLHVHSHHTRGGTLAPRAVLRRAREAGLDGVAFTDLNTLDGLDEIRAAGRDEALLALCGVELATDRGHYLCFFPDPAKVPAPPQLFGAATPWPVREVLEKVRALGRRRGRGAPLRQDAGAAERGLHLHPRRAVRDRGPERAAPAGGERPRGRGRGPHEPPLHRRLRCAPRD